MILNIDLSLWTLVLALNAIGYWLMRTKVREWAVPVNVILGILSVSFASVWGLLIIGASFQTLLTYGLPNGLLCWAGCTLVYDFVHEFVKRKAEWLAVWQTIARLVTRKGGKA